VSTDDPLLPLLLAAREGNDVALTELVRRTQPVLWRVCRDLGTDGDAADLVQETYERMLRAMHRYEGRAPVRPWLLRIARNVCADAVRRNQRRRRLIERAAASLEPEARDNADRSIAPLVAALDRDRFEAFVLTQHVGLSYEEAAQVLNCPVGTIRSRVARARTDLRAALRAADSA